MKPVRQRVGVPAAAGTDGGGAPGGAHNCLKGVHHRRGTTALELTCVLPVLMGIILGAVDFGRFAQFENIVSNAARVGAEYGATHRRTTLNAANWETRLTAAVTEEAQHLPEFNAALLEISINNVTQADGTRRVEVAAAYPFTTIVDWPGLPRQVPLRHSVVYQEYR